MLLFIGFIYVCVRVIGLPVSTGGQLLKLSLMYYIINQENWNGALLLECFPVIRPASDGLSVGLEIQVFNKKDLVGYAKVVSGIQIKWSSLNDNICYMYMGHPVPYVKKVLSNVFGFSATNPCLPDFPLFFGFAHWLEHHMPVKSLLFQKQYDKAKLKQTKLWDDQSYQESLFIDTVG